MASLLDVGTDVEVGLEQNKLQQESTELMKIFGAILTKSMAQTD